MRVENQAVKHRILRAVTLPAILWLVMLALIVMGADSAVQGQVRKSKKQLESEARRAKVKEGAQAFTPTPTANATPTTGAVAMKTIRILTRASVDTTFWANYGLLIKDWDRQVVLRTRLKNMGMEKRDLNLEVLFIGETPAGKYRYIFAKTNEVIPLEAGEWTERVSISPVLSARVVQYIAPGGRYYYRGYESEAMPNAGYGVKYSSGHKIEGYIVRVLEGERTLAVDTSNQYLRDEAWDETVIKDWLAKGGLLPL